jgi:hypothetical protein
MRAFVTFSVDTEPIAINEGECAAGGKSPALFCGKLKRLVKSDGSFHMDKRGGYPQPVPLSGNFSPLIHLPGLRDNEKNI